MDESNLQTSNVVDDNAVDGDIQIKMEKRESIDGTKHDDDDDDDVIVVPTEEPIITEIPDDDEDHVNNRKMSIESSNKDADTATTSSANHDKSIDNGKPEDSSFNNESDVQILEPQISVMDLDEFDDPPENGDTIKGEQVFPVKIKEEPKYEGYEDEDDGFEDVGTYEIEPIVTNVNDEASCKLLISFSFFQYLI